MHFIIVHHGHWIGNYDINQQIFRIQTRYTSQIKAKSYPGYSLATIFVCRTNTLGYVWRVGYSWPIPTKLSSEPYLVFAHKSLYAGVLSRTITYLWFTDKRTSVHCFVWNARKRAWYGMLSGLICIRCSRTLNLSFLNPNLWGHFQTQTWKISHLWFICHFMQQSSWR